MFLYRITWIWLTSFLRDLYHYNFLLYFHGNNSVLCCYFFFSWAISVIYQEHYPFYAEAHMKLVMQYQLITLSNISRWSLLCSISRYLPWAVSVACYGDGTINDWTKDQIEDSTLFFHMNFLLMYKKRLAAEMCMLTMKMQYPTCFYRTEIWLSYTNILAITEYFQMACRYVFTSYHNEFYRMISLTNTDLTSSLHIRCPYISYPFVHYHARGNFLKVLKFNFHLHN